MEDVMTRFGRLARSALAAAIALLAACNRDRAVAKTDTALENAADALSKAADSVAGRVAGREYTNGELTALVNAYNDAEIEMGEMAQAKATDTAVRNFARRIVTEQRALKAEVTATVQRLNITPLMPSDDEDLRADHQKGLSDLNGKAKGREFDEAFLEHEIAMHKKVLDEVDDALGRNRNQEIRTLLEHVRDGLRAQLTRAEELEKKFGAA
jgi:putative membrane protein